MQSIKFIAFAAATALAPAVWAAPQAEVIEPASGNLDFGSVLIDVPSPSQRVRVRNTSDTDAVVALHPRSFPFVTVGGPEFAIVPAGEAVAWDVACQPTESSIGHNGSLDINVRDASGAPGELELKVPLACRGGLLDWSPFFQVRLPQVFSDETSLRSLRVPNRTNAPITITEVRVAAPFTASVVGGVPQRIAPGRAIELDFTGEGDGRATVDVLAGTDIVGRVPILAETLSVDFDPRFWEFGDLPQGATHTRPIRILNSANVTRTITSASFTQPHFSISNIAGRALAPGEKIDATIAFHAAIVDVHSAQLVVDFDTGDNSVFFVSSRVKAPTFSIFALDQTPNDGRLDFGTVVSGSHPILRIFVIKNVGAERAIVACAKPNLPFEMLTPCPTTLPADGSAVVVIRMTPRRLGAFHDQLFLEAAPRSGEFSGLRLPLGLDARVVEPAFALESLESGAPADELDDAAAESGGCSTSGAPSAALLVIAIGLCALRRRR